MSGTKIASPIGSRVLVKRDAADDKTEGGIVLPDQAVEKPSRGLVVAVGSGQLLQDGTRAVMEVGDGDTVVFGAYAGTEVTIDDEEFLVLSESDILLVI